MDYLLHVLILVIIYTTLAVSLDLLVGTAGLLPVCQAAFFGVGAYTTALVAVPLRAPFVASTMVGVVFAVLVSLIVSLPALRVRGDYFVIATFGFQVILFSIFNNWIDLTRGPLGITGIAQPTILGRAVRSRADFLLLSCALAAIAYVVVWRLAASPFGRVLRAIREDEVFAESLGKNVFRFKVTAFAVSAGLAAAAGSVYACYMTYIDPTSFSVMESILIISMVVIGGAGSPWGPLVGAAAVVGLPEILRLLGFPGALAANLRQVTYGVLLVVMMMVRPRGLLGRYGFER